MLSIDFTLGSAHIGYFIKEIEDDVAELLMGLPCYKATFYEIHLAVLMIGAVETAFVIQIQRPPDHK